MTESAPSNLLLLVVVPAAIAIGIWMGVRKYRELGQIARDALAGNEEALATLRNEATRQPVRVRLFFRVLGFIVGPVTLLGGLVLIGMSLSSLVEDGLQIWWHTNLGLVLAGILTALVGLFITRAAVTGQDRYLR